jgi:CRISPR/Cas system-associated exonuclease Cas4 (RecB family)
MSYQWIRASEISDYLYCRRAWWLKRVRGQASQNEAALTTGTYHHQQHGRSVQRSIWSRRLAYAILFMAVALITFQILMGL